MNEILPQRQPEGHGVPAANALYSFEQMVKLAEAVAKSGFIKGAKTPDAALALMLVCQAQGRQIGEAITRFHVIEGVPSVKADVMLADFQARGGRLRWIETNNQAARAEFSHPQYHPDPLTIEVTIEELIDNGTAMCWSEKDRRMVLKTNYLRNPAAMLRARVQTQGIRAVDPGAIHGFYTPEEVSDFAEPIQAEARIAGTEGPADAPAPLSSGPAVSPSGTIQDLPVPGFPGPGFDDRPYHLVVSHAGEALNAELLARAADALGEGQTVYQTTSRIDLEFHRRLLLAAVNKAHADGPPPSKMSEAIRVMDAVYRSQREWVRSQINALADSLRQGLEDAIATASVDAIDPDHDPTPPAPATPPPASPRPVPEPPWEPPAPPKPAEPILAPPVALSAADAKMVYTLDGKEVTAAQLIDAAKRYGYEPVDGLFRTSDAAYILRENNHRVGTRS